MFLLLSSFSYAQDHSGEGESGFINEMELGLDTKDGLVEIHHFKSLKNTDTSVFFLPGTLYLAGHTGHFDTMGYDRFSLFLLNLVNHHGQKYRGMQLESGLKLFGVEQQPFGAEPGSSLKFLRLNFTEINITSVKNLNDKGDMKVHFVLAGKFGLSQQNASLTVLEPEDEQLLQNFLNCNNCYIDPNGAKVGTHYNVGLNVEFEIKKLLIKTYAELNRDYSQSTIMNQGQNLNYKMTEKKIGIEVEYPVLNLKKAGDIYAFTSLEYYNLNQTMSVDDSNYPPQPRIKTDGLLFKFGLKYNIGTFKKKKKPNHH